MKAEHMDLTKWIGAGALYFLAASITAQARDDDTTETMAHPGKFPLEIVISDARDVLPLIHEDISTGGLPGTARLDAAVSVGVYGDDLFDAFAPSRIEDVVSYAPGIAPSSFQAGYATALMVRGFHTQGEVFVNGHRDNRHFYTRDLATVERVEVLKGHGAVLYGSGSPGATLNYLTRRPSAFRESSIRATVGNNEFIRGELDSTGVIPGAEELRYRLIVAGQNGDTLYDYVEDERWVAYPAFQWRYADEGSLRMEIEAAENHRPYHFGTVYTLGQVLYDKSYVFPQAEANKRHDRLGLYWDHRFNGHIGVHASFNHFVTDRDDLHVGFLNKRDEVTLNGYYREVSTDYRQDTGKLELALNLPTRGLAHDLRLGLDFNDADEDVRSKRNLRGFVIDPFKPDLTVDLSGLTLTPRNYIIENTETALYAFDRVALGDQLSAELGVRFSEYDSHFKMNNSETTTSENDTLSKSASLIYKPSSTVAYHLSLTESFQPNTGTDRNLKYLDAKVGRQIEFGIRSWFPEWRIALDSAIYQLTQSNLPSADPDDPDFLVLSGKRRSRGFEWAAERKINEGPTLRLGYSYIDAEFVRSDAGIQGNTPASIPRHSGYLTLSYAPDEQPDWRIWSGINGSSERWGNDANTFKVPGYALLDLGAELKWRDVRFLASIVNALDKRYVAASFADYDIYQGDRRQIRLAAEYRF